MPNRPLSIFVHRASQHLTDHDPHGDGLICFSLLNGLATRGHRVVAVADTAAVANGHPGLEIMEGRHRSPANALGPWELGWRADRLLARLHRGRPFDLVWRMHPYGVGCPTPPVTGGLPLVVGPLFYDWPAAAHDAVAARPRLGIGIAPLLAPLAALGWRRTLRRADLIVCATPRHADVVRADAPRARVEPLPVIVPPPRVAPAVVAAPADQVLRLVHVGNLHQRKDPLLFCRIVRRLRDAGRHVEGLLVGDGPERPAVERFVSEHRLSPAVRLVGQVPNSAVPQYLAGASFLVSTAVGEPYGRNVVEAMAAGIPCVCHASGGPADLIADGTTGILVAAADDAAYATAIADAWDAPETVGRLGRAAAAAAAAWRPDAVLDRLEQLLRDSVAGRGDRPALAPRGAVPTAAVRS
ncbi:MAG TPA: glycosyltransferase [Humisphaera sp.]